MRFCETKPIGRLRRLRIFGQRDKLKADRSFHKIITPQGKPSKQWREHACVLIAERILQRKIEFYNSPAMERGLIVEADAVAARVFVPGRDYRLGDPTSAVLAAVEHAHGGVLCRGLSEALDAHILGDKAG